MRLRYTIATAEWLLPVCEKPYSKQNDYFELELCPVISARDRTSLSNSRIVLFNITTMPVVPGDQPTDDNLQLSRVANEY